MIHMRNVDFLLNDREKFPQKYKVYIDIFSHTHDFSHSQVCLIMTSPTCFSGQLLLFPTQVTPPFLATFSFVSSPRFCLSLLQMLWAAGLRPLLLTLCLVWAFLQSAIKVESPLIFATGVLTTLGSFTVWASPAAFLPSRIHLPEVPSCTPSFPLSLSCSLFLSVYTTEFLIYAAPLSTPVFTGPETHEKKNPQRHTYTPTH